MIESLLYRAQRRVARHLRPEAPRLRYPDPISIDSLVVPLRYDILVRRDYFDFFANQIGTYTQDFDEYMRRVRRHPYAVWFRDVCARVFHPEYLNSEARFEAELRDRVRRSAELFFSFEQHGFDASYPVKLKSGSRILPTSTGKRVKATIFAGDGCHRLALLLLAGRHQLEPGEFVVQWEPSFQPRDVTSLLIRAGVLGNESYWRFLSRKYATSEYLDREDLLRHVRQTAPEWLAELDAIIAIDEPLFEKVWS